MPPDSNQEPSSDGIFISTDKGFKKQIMDLAIPAFFNAMDIAEACSDCIGCDLNGLFERDNNSSAIPSKLTTDFISLLTNIQPNNLLTQEATQLVKLRMLAAEFNNKLSPFRMNLSYR